MSFLLCSIYEYIMNIKENESVLRSINDPLHLDLLSTFLLPLTLLESMNIFIERDSSSSPFSFLMHFHWLYAMQIELNSVFLCISLWPSGQLIQFSNLKRWEACFYGKPFFYLIYVGTHTNIPFWLCIPMVTIFSDVIFIIYTSSQCWGTTLHITWVI